ncbi:ATP-binding protein [Spiribacter vilamensis]|uniref:histidine kinase n=1 Tax=Spiribacter vilamensis TaxID=531306 RepID=A0A4Q8D2J5_9GAMM|nr:ATP-binding protein [Spiribacter vilamensis]RZU99618.1 PAS domain S-box-containing protein [Spiribacter vilamensis]
MWAVELLAILVGLLSMPAAADLANPAPGVLDLRHWQPSDTPIALDGDWLIAWADRDEVEPYVMPGVWNGRVIAGVRRDGEGNATLRARLLLPRTDTPLALRINNIKSASQVFLDGEKVAERGRPGTDSASEQADLSGMLVPLPDRGTAELRIQLSNHFHFEGGIDRSVYIGDQRAMESKARIDDTWSLLGIGGMGGLAVYLLALGAWRQISLPGALFVALLLIAATRFAAVSGVLYELPWLTPGMIIRADYLPAFLLPGAYALLLGSLFPDDLWRPVRWGIVGVSTLLGATVLMPPSVFTSLRDPTAVFVIATVLFLALSLLRAVRNRRPGARLVLAGAALLSATAVNDALVAVRLLESSNLIVPGTLGFLAMHGVAVGGRVFDTMEENRRLSDSLRHLTHSLETQVTDRTAALHQKSALLDGALESMAPAVLATTSHGDPQAWNTAFAALFRVEDAVLNSRRRDVLIAGLRDSLGSVASLNGVIPFDGFAGAHAQRVTLPGGEVVEVSAHRRNDGGWVCTFIDVTARRLSETGPQGGAVGTWEWDLIRRRFQGSARYWYSLGYDPRRMRRSHIDSVNDIIDLAHPEDRGTARGALNEVFRSPGRVVARELRVRQRSGEWLWILVRACLVRDRNGEPIRLVAAQSDIQALVEARQSLERARDEARHDAVEKGRLLAVLSHEIRTPLHGMLGQLDLLQREPEMPTAAEPRLALARRTGHETVTLLEDIVAMSGVEAGRQLVRQEPFSPRELLAHVVELVQPRVESSQLAITGRVCESVPDELLGDAPKLRQILLNLLDNAIKFTDAGEIALTMERTGDGWYRLVATDPGRGMAEDETERIFDAFYHSTDVPGAGLGLYIVGRLTRLLGGQVQAESAPGSGSRIFLDLPLDAAKPCNTAEIPSVPRTLGVRVLLVEDEPANRAAVQEILQAEGQKVTAVATAAETLELIAAGNEFDMILLDLRLPGMDGVSVMEQLAVRRQGRKIPVVAFTADDTAERRSAFLQAGGSAVLTKPLELDAFYRLLAGVSVTERSPGAVDDRWSELADRVGTATLARLLDILRDSLCDMRAELETAVTRSDAARCREIAHRIQGSAANYALHKIEAQASVVNHHDDSESINLASELVTTVNAELIALDRRLSEPSS